VVQQEGKLGETERNLGRVAWERKQWWRMREIGERRRGIDASGHAGGEIGGRRREIGASRGGGDGPEEEGEAETEKTGKGRRGRRDMLTGD
jgi:hypothetical protein